MKVVIGHLAVKLRTAVAVSVFPAGPAVQAGRAPQTVPVLNLQCLGPAVDPGPACLPVYTCSYSQGLGPLHQLSQDQY